jgi:hypothetical protein
MKKAAKPDFARLEAGRLNLAGAVKAHNRTCWRDDRLNASIKRYLQKVPQNRTGGR